MEPERAEVFSADGTRLVAEVRGSGSPLVLVHGTSVSRADWLRLPELLARRHTVWSYDRRGRGDSGDAPDDYALEREVDDVLALLATAGGPAHLLGHSFGARCAMEAALAGPSLRSLVLYEPPVHVARESAAVRRAGEQLEAGDPEGAVSTFLMDIAGMPADDLESFRSTGAEWPATVARAATICREIRALAELAWDPARFVSITAPTLYIAGELSEAAVYASRDDVATALPHASHVTIPGQEHLAFVYEPEGFADVVLGFTSRHED